MKNFLQALLVAAGISAFCTALFTSEYWRLCLGLACMCFLVAFVVEFNKALDEEF